MNVKQHFTRSIPWVLILSLLVSACYLPGISLDPTPEVREPPSPNLPAAPSGLTISERMCSPNSYLLKLTWVASPSTVTGQRLYRNGALVATLAPNVTSYEDQLPFGGPYTYALESFNDQGTSAQVQVTDTPCIYEDF